MGMGPCEVGRETEALCHRVVGLEVGSSLEWFRSEEP